MRKQLIFLLSLGLLAACSSAAGTKTTPDAAAADAQTAADAAADAGADAAADAAADTAGTDAAAATPATDECAAMAVVICGRLKDCCAAPAGSGCIAAQTAACLKAGYAQIEDGAAAGSIQRDATRHAACQKAMTSSLLACDLAGVVAARERCLYAWIDKAALGDACDAGTAIACAGGSGRCDPKASPTDFSCAKAGGDGDACMLSHPCNVDLACLNGTLTRMMTCGAPGSTCNLSDKCPEGLACSGGKCVAPSGTNAGNPCDVAADDCGMTDWCDAGTCKARAAKDGACAKDGECAAGLSCQAQKCAPKFCAI